LLDKKEGGCENKNLFYKRRNPGEAISSYNKLYAIFAPCHKEKSEKPFAPKNAARPARRRNTIRELKE
jgi:hypothetical protein